MTFVDYYGTLGVAKTATPKTIKNAYYKLARKFHPDLNPDDERAKKRFQEVNEANEVLSDPIKRKKFDQYGKDWQHAEEFEKAQQNQSSNQASGSFSNQQQSGAFSDFFESMFGGGSTTGRGGRQAKYKGEDYNSELHLNLMDAYTTHKQSFAINGKTIRITIPAGIENGQQIKIPGQGGIGMNGGPNGNLFITFLVSNLSKFERRNSDLYTTIDLNMYTAILGGEITVDTLDGKVKLQVAPETQNGSKIKLKRKGFPIYKKEGQFGDLYITYLVKIPTGLTENQRKLFTELSNS